MVKVDLNNVIRRDLNGNVEVLKDIKFDIAEGKVYTILGKNGSGKSTLIKSLTNLLNKNLFNVSGSVIWNGEDIFFMSEDRLLKLRRKEISYVLQDLTNNFDPLKKLKYYFDNSGFAGEIILEHLKSFLLPDYKTISQLHSYEISGGMAQRLSLMFALLPNPKLLVLDEPTSAIDYTNINLVKLKLKEFTSNNNSALVVTQDIYFAKEISDEIAFLSNGSLSEFKSAETFFADVDDNNYSNLDYKTFAISFSYVIPILKNPYPYVTLGYSASKFSVVKNYGVLINNYQGRLESITLDGSTEGLKTSIGMMYNFTPGFGVNIYANYKFYPEVAVNLQGYFQGQDVPTVDPNGIELGISLYLRN